MADEEPDIGGFAAPSGDDLSVSEKRSKVLEALFEAAESGNVPAILKWLELHRGQFDDPASAPAGGDDATETPAIQAVVEPEMLAALRAACRVALDSHDRKDRRGVTNALRDIEGLVGGASPQARSEIVAPKLAIHRELEELFGLPGKQ